MKPQQVIAKYLKQKADAGIKKTGDVVNAAGESLSRKNKIKNKAILIEKKKVSVVENQPVYSKDKSRFFKTAWEEENRQLYFQ